MKVYEIRETKGIESLQVAEREEPSPGYGEAKVKMKAASLNYRDLSVARGAYGRGVSLPLIPLSDGAGEVVELGPGVTRWAVGDRVAGIFMQKWICGGVDDAKAKSALGGAIDGVLAEYVVFNQEGLVRIPDHLSFEEAATLPCAGVTAWHGLNGIKPGDSVLVQGTGGVSIFALQFALIAGAQVVATSSSDAKLARVREMGASRTINYKTTPDWEKAAAGVDYVIEVGGAGTLAKSMKAVRMGGTISLIGVLTGNTGEVNPTPLLMKTIRLQGIYVGSRDMFEAMNRAIALRGMHPIIDRVFPFPEAREAYKYLESGAHFGKVVIKF
ncbi:MAG: NADPH:qui reductase or related Zn-dependent oxidoreductase [Bryobacterales bacterium]|nr:NADPH:qui reductase or related Zn-dependent oxidoreductase [Bryobacterales bacterium]